MPVTASKVTAATPDRSNARRFKPQSIIPARIMPPNTSFEISMQYFPISANSTFSLSSVIVSVVCPTNIANLNKRENKMVKKEK